MFPSTTVGKQTSRKGKKAWRKNVDVTEVREGLEELRSEIITGGVIKEKPDEALFALDTVGSQDLIKPHLKTLKPLKCDEILAQRSAIPALEGRKRPNSMVTDGILTEKKKHRSNGVSQKDLDRLRRMAFGQEETQDAVKVSVVAAGQQTDWYDPWSDVAVEEKKKDELDDLPFLEKPKPKVAPITTKYTPMSLTASKANIPAVRLPHAGTSYNPEFEKWDELLTEEGNREVEAEKRRIAEAEKDARMRAAGDAMNEDAQESSDSEEDSDDEDEPSTKTSDSFVKKRPTRKTQVERNKIKRRKEQERQARHLDKMRKQKHQLEALKSIARAVSEKEQTKLQLLASGMMAVDEDTQTLRRRKFGKHALPKAPLELQLPDELADSLRRLKPEGNLLRDRMRSFRERGMMETRLPITQRKKVKKIVSEKWAYKDWKF